MCSQRFCIIAQCINTNSFFINSPFDEYSGCFYVFTIVSGVAITILFHLMSCKHWNYHTTWQRISSNIFECLNLRNDFSEVVALICASIVNGEETKFWQHEHLIFRLCLFIRLIIMVLQYSSDICISLIIDNLQHLSTYLEARCFLSARHVFIHFLIFLWNSELLKKPLAEIIFYVFGFFNAQMYFIYNLPSYFL